MTNANSISSTEIIQRAADLLADLYDSGLSDQYGIQWLKARAAALGYSVEIKKRGPRNLYQFCGFDRPPIGREHYTPTAWATLPNARKVVDELPNLLETYDLPADILNASETVGRWPNPSALCDRMIEALVAHAGGLAETSDEMRASLYSRVPLAAKAAA